MSIHNCKAALGNICNGPCCIRTIAGNRAVSYSQVSSLKIAIGFFRSQSDSSLHVDSVINNIGAICNQSIVVRFRRDLGLAGIGFLTGAPTALLRCAIDHNIFLTAGIAGKQRGGLIVTQDIALILTLRNNACNTIGDFNFPGTIRRFFRIGLQMVAAGAGCVQIAITNLECKGSINDTLFQSNHLNTLAKGYGAAVITFGDSSLCTVIGLLFRTHCNRIICCHNDDAVINLQVRHIQNLVIDILSLGRKGAHRDKRQNHHDRHCKSNDSIVKE